MTPPSDLNNTNSPLHPPEEARALFQPRPLPLPALPAPAAPPALTAAPNALLLLKALRRRLRLALTVGLVFSAVAGVATFFLMPPPKHVARTQLYVSAVPPNILFPDDNRGRHEDFVRSQAFLIRDRFVLSAALRSLREAGAELSMVEEQADPAQWLESELKVETPSSEFIHISLSGDRPDELQMLVCAVTQSYLDNVVEKEASLRKKKLQSLTDLFEKYNKRVQTKRDTIRKLQKDNGALTEQSLALLQQIDIEDLKNVMKDLGEVKHQLRQLHVELGLRPDWVEMVWPRYAAALNCLPGLALPVNHALVALSHDEALVSLATLKSQASMVARELDELISKDKIVEAGENHIQKLQIRLEHMRENAHPEVFKRQSAPLQKELMAVSKEVEARRHELRPILFEKFRVKLKEQSALNHRQIWDRYTMLKEMETTLFSDAQRLEQSTKRIRKDAMDLGEYKEQLEKDEKILQKASEKLESMEVEKEAPSRITLLSKDEKNKPLAMVIKPKESNRKWMATGGAAVGALALVLLAFAWFEFQSRKVVSPQEVVEGLGLRLMGTVPDYLRRGWMDWLRPGDGSSAYSQSMLTESVDSARTMLLHAARQDKIQIVMITSALAGEGKTSLASHLAASLARAGRRTLLVDSDLRNPTLHRLFDRSRAPGLSELMRGEVDMVGVLRDTPVPNLWLISAGQADVLALQTLALDAIPQLFQQLRRQYDFIVVDSCPVLPVADSLLVGQHVDGVIFSLLREVSRLPRVHAACQKLAVLGVRMLGAVVNGAHEDTYPSDYRYLNSED